MDLKQIIKELSQKYYPEILDIRRHIHKNPELSFEEFNTSKYICSKLDEYHIPYRAGYVKTGIIGTIKGKNPNKKVIALRADMDALPIIEDENNPIKSCNKGVMHACGHDAHSASLLGTAKILNELKDQWEGTILLIFQPGEEKFPGGAKLLMEEGALDNPKPEIIIGQHVLPDMETGHVGFKEGMYMASGDEIYLTIKGKGGHAAMPHILNDNVLIAANIIVSMQQIVSRMVPANIPTVLSFGKVIADGATNIIPEKVEIAGTLRTMNEEWRAKIKTQIRKIATEMAQSMGATCEVKINDGYPVVTNHIEITEKAYTAAQKFLGNERVHKMDIRMTAEDFGYYTQAYPCTFYRFGVQQANNFKTGGLHTPGFNLNESALETSVGLMAYIALDILGQ
ncbi:M20 metallopeptidase family protein [Saccharicrinis fermentans]|uniref:Putative hydrolase YxeP n=1 Tax=Saccharicrinis fermentans DSM 9555 = JCM 21142 TaxID=869213 RepID=W7YBF1_9BACT|nr:M20 family metallopeptidase [Saccharicrinis fermentans]GAF05762.1 putative hydrolase YxeP [Saccharicrinis fermentans DSM 9555 = JCM 21142]